MDYDKVSAENKDNNVVPIYNVETGKVEEVLKIIKTEQEWKKILTPEEFQVTRKKGTEEKFTCDYLNNKQNGVYVCVCCQTSLFIAETKYDSQTGWPSFFEPVSEYNIKTQDDYSFFTTRTEVLCARCDAHLGHVFNDGPPPTYKRYCINGVALKFIGSNKNNAN